MNICSRFVPLLALQRSCSLRTMRVSDGNCANVASQKHRESVDAVDPWHG